MAHVFISYATEDRATAAQLAQWLERNGWDVWWDRDLVVGAQFEEVIEERLDSAFAVIVLWSSVSVSSKWVRAEAASAADRDALVPISIEPCKIPLRFRTLHTLDLVGWTRSADDVRLLNVEKALAQRLATVEGAVHDSNAHVLSASDGQPTSATSRPQARRWWLGAIAVVVVGAAAIILLRTRMGVAPIHGESELSPTSSSKPTRGDLMPSTSGTASSSPAIPTSSASVSTSSPSPAHETFMVEAEDQRVIAPMAVYTDSQAQGAAFVQSTVLNAGVVRFDVVLAGGGQYWVWGRFSSTDPQLDHNSFGVSVDGDTDVWDFFAGQDLPGPGWHWELVSLRCGGTFERHFCDPWRPTLGPGRHRFAISGREPLSALDVIVITNDPTYDPDN